MFFERIKNDGFWWVLEFFVVVVQFHQYQVVGRGLPTENDEHPKIYRMKLWATNEVRAKSKFWYEFLSPMLIIFLHFDFSMRFCCIKKKFLTSWTWSIKHKRESFYAYFSLVFCFTWMFTHTCKCVSLLAYRYFLRKLKKVKKSNGQVLAINEVCISHSSRAHFFFYLPMKNYFGCCPVGLAP